MFPLFWTACGLTVVVPRVASPLFASPQHHDWHPSISPGSTTLLVTHRVTVLEFCWRMASSIYEYSSCRSAVCTACVMLSADSTRHESHAAEQDVFEQVPTHRHVSGPRILVERSKRREVSTNTIQSEWKIHISISWILDPITLFQ